MFILYTSYMFYLLSIHVFLCLYVDIELSSLSALHVLEDAHVRRTGRQGGHVAELGIEDVAGGLLGAERLGDLRLGGVHRHLPVIELYHFWMLLPIPPSLF